MTSGFKLGAHDNAAADSPPSAQPASEYSKPSRRSAAMAGIVSAGLGLGVAEIAAGLSRTLRSPVIAVGDRVVDLVPAPVKDVAIDLFGTNDKIALLVGIAVTLTIYAGLVGIVTLRHRRVFGMVGVGLFALVGSWAALSDRAGSPWWSILPTVIGAMVVVGALAEFERVTNLEPSGMNHPSSRRRFFATAGVIAAGAAVAGTTGRGLDARFSARDSREALDLPQPTQRLAAIPPGAQAENAAPFFTPNSDFYRIDTALIVPQVPAETWSMKVTGMVDRELTLSYADLLNRELIERDITLACVSNTVGGELIGTARWLGARLDDLLAEAGIDPAATQVVGRSVDGYTCGFPVAALDGRDALIAVGMNGEPLPLEHGFPARLIVPGLYGYVSATKWLSEIELTTFDAFDHYWVPRGYAVEAPIKLQSRIDTPRGLDRIAPGPFVIGGVAWAQTIGIESVELSIDEGPWLPADLADEVNDDTWRQWSFPWEATPGRHSVTVRAKDRNGSIQTADRSEPLPDGASGHHTVVVLVDQA
ncbi:MAG: molybdopterin-dependent oxidoreductase [Acidimicrobiales bacterium]|nr:molybdopterin-dependent oxidoreductase [Acidimicrobiales bacterium]